MKIKDLELVNPYMLAPMASFTDYPFRYLCEGAGAGMLVTEMVSARGLVYNSKNTLELLHIGKSNRTAIQLFSNEPEIVADCVKMPELEPFIAIDLNMGCPVPKIVKSGMGSALMRDLSLSSKVIESAVLNTPKPVTVKFRLGWDKEHKNALEFAKMCQDAGASMVTIHGRTREQMYSGVADWDMIGEIKSAVKIPVILNGDVFDSETAKKVMSEYGVDGVAIGRGALGNPWIFAELSGTDFPQDRLKVLLKHYDLAVKEYGEKRAIPFMRKHLAWYLKRANIKRSLRAELNIVNEYSRLIEMLKDAFS